MTTKIKQNRNCFHCLYDIYRLTYKSTYTKIVIWYLSKTWLCVSVTNEQSSTNEKNMHIVKCAQIYTKYMPKTCAQQWLSFLKCVSHMH